MFGIGEGELIAILLLAVIFLGPQRLPEVARWLAKAYQILLNWKAEFDHQLAEIRREVEEETEVDLMPEPKPSKEVAAPEEDDYLALTGSGQKDATPSYSYRQEMLPGIDDEEDEHG